MTEPVLTDEMLDNHVGIMGKTGSGKSNVAKLAVEHMLDAGERVCIIDPTGSWFGLRLMPDLTPSPYRNLVVFGGEHADVPIGAAHGNAVAEIIATSSTPAIIDTQQMSVGARTAFFADFGQRIFQKNRGALHLVVDEAHLFAPKGRVANPKSGEMLHAANNLASLGRGRGIRMVFLSQRPAKLHNDSLTQIETLIAMRLTAHWDVDAIKDWIKTTASLEEAKDMVSSLPKLRTGSGWLWAPGLDVLRQFDAPLVRTLDTGKPTDQVYELSPIDVGAVTQQLGALEVEVAANDPARLKARIRELEAIVKSRADYSETILGPDPRVAELERQLRLAGEALMAMRAERDRAATSRDTTVAALLDFAGDLAELEMRVRAGHEQLQRRAFEDDQHIAPATPTTTGRKEGRAMGAGSTGAAEPRAMPRGTEAPTTSEVSEMGGEARLGKPHLAILAALSSYPLPLTQTQLAFLADYHPRSKGFTNALGTLRSAGLITAGFPETLTDEGRRRHLDLPPMRTPRALFEERLGAPGRRILDRLIDVWPNEDTRDELAAAAGYEHVRSKGFTNALGQLRGLGLVDGFRIHPDFAQLLGL